MRCSRCQSSDVWTDEVWHRGRMLLGECRQCAHRWTRLLPGWSRVEEPADCGEPVRAVRRVGTEIAAAA